MNICDVSWHSYGMGRSQESKNKPCLEPDIWSANSLVMPQDGVQGPHDPGVARSRPPGDELELFVVESVQADVDGVQAGLGQFGEGPLQGQAVGRHGNMADSVHSFEVFDQRHDVFPHEGLASSQPDLVHSVAGKYPGQPQDLFCGQEVRLWCEGHALYRHAVLAAEVAPLGHRYPEVVVKPAK